ncbi:hypothetical protein ALC53_11374, partial [Atta colombica]
ENFSSNNVLDIEQYENKPSEKVCQKNASVSLSQRQMDRYDLKEYAALTRKYEYLICGKSFPKPSFRTHVLVHTLKEYILSHNRIKPCKYCSKRYNKPWSLKMHKYWHTGLKRFNRDFCKTREGTVCKSYSHTLHTSVRNFTSIMPAKV